MNEGTDTGNLSFFPCIRILTGNYSGPTREFLLQHGCKLVEIDAETMRVTLPYGSVRKETLHYHAVHIYTITLPDGASFREWQNSKREHSLLMNMAHGREQV